MFYSEKKNQQSSFYRNIVFSSVYETGKWRLHYRMHSTSSNREYNSISLKHQVITGKLNKLFSLPSTVLFPVLKVHIRYAINEYLSFIQNRSPFFEESRGILVSARNNNNWKDNQYFIISKVWSLYLYICYQEMAYLKSTSV